MKRLLLILIICLSSLSAQAQHFDWVRSYFGPDYDDGIPANEVLGSVMDSKGNVYILGQFLGSARWDDDTGILPFSAHRNRSAVIAKFSPTGEMLWHKELYSSYTDVNVYTIRMLGDTALMLYSMFMFPFDHGYSEKNELYYFDTLLTTSERFPQAPDSLVSPDFYYVFSTLGLESGNVIEEHSWIPAFVKNDGSLLRFREGGYLCTNLAQRNSFNVDSDGNIILARVTNDLFGIYCDTCPGGRSYWSPSYGNLRSFRMLIDGGSKILEVPLEPSSVCNYQLLKLSPHFDSIIASTYIFDSTWRDTHEGMRTLNLNSIDIDINDNIYMAFDRTQYPLDRMPVKKSDTLAMEWSSCMIKYNSELMPTGLVQVTASEAPSGHPAGVLSIISTYYDTTSNSLFLRGTSGRSPEYSTLNYRGDTLNLMNNACWLRLNADDLNLLSYGKARSLGTRSYERTYFYSDRYAWSHNGSFVASGNRVFCQLMFQSNILYKDTQINSPYGMGLFIWDYDGHELAYIDYNSNSIDNQHAYIHFKDCSLLVSGTLAADADFGSFHVNAAYNSHAYLAKYTDTAFMLPYVYTDPHPEQIDETEQSICQIYPNPTCDNLFINVTDEQISNVYIISSLGKRKEIKVFGNRVSLSMVPSGIYYLQIITNRNIYQQKIIKI
ncbi:MAG: T9SS type A sorting domain-containing protein [Bacteroidales bacterium]|nr:T9SS type A sorting domain-containing protein [Bacteroidales bacterium]